MTFDSHLTSVGPVFPFRDWNRRCLRDRSSEENPMSELKKYSFILPSTSLTAFSHEIDFKSILYLSSPSKGKLSI